MCGTRQPVNERCASTPLHMLTCVQFKNDMMLGSVDTHRLQLWHAADHRANAHTPASDTCCNMQQLLSPARLEDFCLDLGVEGLHLLAHADQLDVAVQRDDAHVQVLREHLHRRQCSKPTDKYEAGKPGVLRDSVLTPHAACAAWQGSCMHQAS
jgi:hypothetical protein